jgi:integrase/recombinase XerD
MNTGARPITEEELPLILAQCTGRYATRDRCLILMGAHTGYRISEMLSMTVDSVWDGHQVSDYVVVEKGFMKGKKRSRSMPLHDKVRTSVQEWLTEYLPGLDDITGRPLFPRQHTRYAMSRSKAADMLKTAAGKAGLDTNRISCHSTRKHFALRMWESPLVNRDMAKMAHLLGHANYSNTLRYLEFGNELEKAVLSI